MAAEADAGPRNWEPRYTEAPHPDWKPGDKQSVPFSGDYITLNPSELGGSACYPLACISQLARKTGKAFQKGATCPHAEVISSVVPRPIGFMSTVSEEGKVNLSPYSYFGAMGHDPPMVAVGCCRSGARAGAMKDTCANALATKEFVVNIMSRWYVEAANHTCGNYDAGVNEFEVSGLTPLPSEVAQDLVCQYVMLESCIQVKAPRVAESAVHMECIVKHSYDVKNDKGEDTTTIILGEVVRYHIHDGVAGKSPSGKTVVDPVKLNPMCRLGEIPEVYRVPSNDVTYKHRPRYGVTTQLFDLPRPDREAQNRVL